VEQLKGINSFRLINYGYRSEFSTKDVHGDYNKEKLTGRPFDDRPQNTVVKKSVSFFEEILLGTNF